jgi:hypothetical protein
VQVLIVLAVGRRLRIVSARTTRFKSATAAAAAINLNIAFSGALEDKAGSGKLILKRRMHALVTKADSLLWNRV